MEGDISSALGASQLQSAQAEAEMGGRVIPINASPMSTPVVVAPAPVRDVGYWLRANWKTLAACIVVALVVVWLTSGEDPVETIKEAAKGAADAAKEVTSAATGS